MYAAADIPSSDGSNDDMLGRIDRSLASFLLLAKFLGVPADAGQIAHDRGRGDAPFLLEDLARIAKRVGLTTRIRQVPVPGFAKLPLPALAETADAETIILLKIEDASLNPRYLVQRGDAERPEIWNHAEATELLTGRFLLMTSREKIVGDKRPFDIAWFRRWMAHTVKCSLHGSPVPALRGMVMLSAWPIPIMPQLGGQ